MSTQDVDMESFDYYLNLALGQRGYERPFAQWEQDSDTNGVTEAPDEEDYEADTESLGDANKENDPSLLPPNLPEPGRRTRREPRRQQQQPPQPRYTQASPPLRPRKKVKLTDPELDFKIFEDETASVAPPFKWEYYGTSVPALGELKNGERFEYTVAHQLRQRYVELREVAIDTRDEPLLNLLQRVMSERYTTWQRFSGATEWTAGCDPMDVWLWVEDKGYHKRWTQRQVEVFKDFLRFMNTCILSAVGLEDPQAAKNMDMWNTSLITGRFEAMKLPNLHMVKNSEVRLSFMPNGPDEKLLYRADYTAEELKILDAGWQGPGRWAPGEGPEEAEEEEQEVEEEESSRESEESLGGSDDEEESEREEADYDWWEGSDLIAL
ncbi:hypothetical protein J3F83DRAFT_767381 [Trichoderma novae-zelandiae]